MKKMMLLTTALLIGTIIHGSDDDRNARKSPTNPATSLKTQTPRIPITQATSILQSTNLDGLNRNNKFDSNAKQDSETSSKPSLRRQIQHNQQELRKLATLIANNQRLTTTLDTQNKENAELREERIIAFKNALAEKDKTIAELQQTLKKEQSSWRRWLINTSYFTTGALTGVSALTVFCIATNRIKFTTPEITFTLPTTSITPQITFTPPAAQ